MFLKPVVPVEQWLDLVKDGVKRFDRGTPLYIRPMYWAEQGSAAPVVPNPETTNWCLTLYDVPMKESAGIALTLSPFRKPTIENAPTDAKAGCLYPNNARAHAEARSRGFDNCFMRDMLGNIAELAKANVFMVRDGVVFTPAPNGNFLNGITRQRVVKLLRESGTEVVEKTLRYEDFESADEIFETANAIKMAPAIRIGDRSLQPGPVYRKARKLYWDYAHS
jgi:branched-chain amino acid aminotransferase